MGGGRGEVGEEVKWGGGGEVGGGRRGKKNEQNIQICECISNLNQPGGLYQFSWLLRAEYVKVRSRQGSNAVIDLVHYLSKQRDTCALDTD